MKILVFGSSGFLGNVISNFFAGEHEVVKADLRRGIDKLDLNVDIIINCIGKTSDSNDSSFSSYYSANVDTVKQVFDYFLKSNATKFIHFSSIAAIEELSSNVVLNEESPSNSKSHYGKSKREAEVFLLSQTVALDKKVIILRPPRIHGPNDQGTIRQLYDFVKKLPYPFYSFQNSRSFLSIDNLLFLINKIIFSEKIKFGIYNVSDDEPMSTNFIIDTIETVEDRKIYKLKIPTKVFLALGSLTERIGISKINQIIQKMTSSNVISNTKIKEALGIDKLPLSAEEGLRKTIRSFTKNKS